MSVCGRCRSRWRCLLRRVRELGLLHLLCLRGYRSLGEEPRVCGYRAQERLLRLLRLLRMLGCQG